MNNRVLEGRNLVKTYRDGPAETPVLKGVSLILHRRERVAIVGSSGSGKSTLLHLLGGLDRPTDGEVLLLGQPFSKLGEAARGRLRNRHMGFVYQFHHLLPELTAEENVMMPLLIRRESEATARDKALALLDAVGLSRRTAHKPSELSGGERQRVALARALVTEPDCVLADEPTGNLDSRSAEQVLSLMDDLNQRFGTALLVVTHDVNIAARMDRTLTLRDGMIRVEE
ncbi:lipoprotein-releasing system ATP-binding protein [Sulfurivirga caldicuralii]|uniref:Lipoprotein-releasing system ATP-binding protein LolD n=1 Tax=Sulfurivirga caldicuralii TaxID=364032 RepID=A0A1N6E1B6_9GAMM|nr:lipoprotein-releasing ABC transporter ATP-binding protein LolD [Sulfurivirga caldicuralii]SIN76806.1 lipoprotein-releasing system ATP-binding protein [Sulfurivirga caldicuralii]